MGRFLSVQWDGLIQGFNKRASGITAMREERPHSRVLYIPHSSIHRLRNCIPPIAGRSFIFPGHVFFLPNNNLLPEIFVGGLASCMRCNGVDGLARPSSQGMFSNPRRGKSLNWGGRFGHKSPVLSGFYLEKCYKHSLYLPSFSTSTA